MAKSNPNIPTVNIIDTNSTSSLVYIGKVTGVPPAGTQYAGIFGLQCLLIDDTGSGIYQMTGTVANPSWTLVGSLFNTSTYPNDLGTVQNSTPTVAQLLGGILTQTSATGAGTVTLPTGTLLSAGVLGVVVGTTFTVDFTNLGGGQTLTITGATGSTVIGTAAVPTGKSATLKFVNTGTNTWNVYVNVSA